jgi:hypothetical protein
MADKLLNHQLRVGIWIIVAIAAANWAPGGFANTHSLIACSVSTKTCLLRVLPT